MNELYRLSIRVNVNINFITHFHDFSKTYHYCVFTCFYDFSKPEKHDCGIHDFSRFSMTVATLKVINGKKISIQSDTTYMNLKKEREKSDNISTT